MTHLIKKEMINRCNKSGELCYTLIVDVDGQMMRFDSPMDYSVADCREQAKIDCDIQLALADPE